MLQPLFRLYMYNSRVHTYHWMEDDRAELVWSAFSSDRLNMIREGIKIKNSPFHCSQALVLLL